VAGEGILFDHPAPVNEDLGGGRDRRALPRLEAITDVLRSRSERTPDSDASAKQRQS